LQADVAFLYDGTSVAADQASFKAAYAKAKASYWAFFDAMISPAS
jgi:hypothetical protein